MLKFKQKAKKLIEKDFDIDDTKFYVKNFIAAEAVTMIYSGSHQGKTWLNLAISRYILETDDTVDELIYFDLDNGRRNIKQRNLEPFLKQYPKWEYYISSKMEQDKYELVTELEDDCHSMNYKNKVLIFDSTRDFLTDVSNDRKAKEFMNVLKKIRDNGGTVIVIHHSSKNGKVIDGSGDFEKSADNLFHLEQKSRVGNVLQLKLHRDKGRDDVDHCGFRIDTTTLSLDELDKDLAMMSEYEESFVNRAKSVLNKNPLGLNKSKLLEALGYEKDDITARDTLDKFVNKFWKVTKDKNRFNITIL